MTSVTPDVAPPSDVLRKWQRIVDLLANIMHVPSAVVTLLEPPHYTHYRTVVSSKSEGNPFPVDQLFGMDIGTFCETVIKSRAPLLVRDAVEDEVWQYAPEVKVGMVSYLGYPVVWPDDRMFGTICVLGDKAYDLLVRLNLGLSWLRRKLGIPGYWSLAGYAKRKVKTALNFIFDFEESAVHHAAERGLDGVICGHIHWATLREINGLAYINCGDWVDSCTGIVEHFDGRLELVHWHGTPPPVVQPELFAEEA